MRRLDHSGRQLLVRLARHAPGLGTLCCPANGCRTAGSAIAIADCLPWALPRLLHPATACESRLISAFSGFLVQTNTRSSQCAWLKRPARRACFEQAFCACRGLAVGHSACCTFVVSGAACGTARRLDRPCTHTAPAKRAAAAARHAARGVGPARARRAASPLPRSLDEQAHAADRLGPALRATAASGTEHGGQSEWRRRRACGGQPGGRRAAEAAEEPEEARAQHGGHSAEGRCGQGAQPGRGGPGGGPRGAARGAGRPDGARIGAGRLSQSPARMPC